MQPSSTIMGFNGGFFQSKVYHVRRIESNVHIWVLLFKSEWWIHLTAAQMHTHAYTHTYTDMCTKAYVLLIIMDLETNAEICGALGHDEEECQPVCAYVRWSAALLAFYMVYRSKVTASATLLKLLLAKPKIGFALVSSKAADWPSCY